MERFTCMRCTPRTTYKHSTYKHMTYKEEEHGRQYSS